MSRNWVGVAAVVATLYFLLILNFFLKTGDAMILVFGFGSAVMLGLLGLALGALVFSARRFAAPPMVACGACARLNADGSAYCNACGKAL